MFGSEPRLRGRYSLTPAMPITCGNESTTPEQQSYCSYHLFLNPEKDSSIQRLFVGLRLRNILIMGVSCEMAVQLL